MLFDSQVVLLHLELFRNSTNNATAQSVLPVNVTIGLAALVGIPPENGPRWGWDVPRPLSADDFEAAIEPGGIAVTTDKHSQTCSASIVVNQSPAPTLHVDQATGGFITATWTGPLNGTAPFVVDLVLAIGMNKSKVVATATAVAGDFGRAWSSAREDWQGWWASVFDPTVNTSLKFEGQLPVLTTPVNETAIRRVYYSNIISLLGLARHIENIPSQAGGHWDGQVIFATGGPVCAVAEMIIWDTTLNSVVLALLQPALFRTYLDRWLTMGIHQHLSIDIVSNRGDQKWSVDSCAQRHACMGGWVGECVGTWMNWCTRIRFVP